MHLGCTWDAIGMQMGCNWNFLLVQTCSPRFCPRSAECWPHFTTQMEQVTTSTPPIVCYSLLSHLGKTRRWAQHSLRASSSNRHQSASSPPLRSYFWVLRRFLRRKTSLAARPSCSPSRSALSRSGRAGSLGMGPQEGPGAPRGRDRSSPGALSASFFGRSHTLLPPIRLSPQLYCIALNCTVLYCTVLYCTVLYCTAL